MQYNLYQKQADFVNSNLPFLWFCGGISSGKSVTGGHFGMRCIRERSDEVGLIFANTNKQLQLATLHKFKSVLRSYSYKEDIDYVVGKNPAPYFGYESKFEEHPGIWSFANGAQIMTFSLESTLEGIEAGWCWGDEVQLASENNLNIIQARVRGSKHPVIRYTLTPPEANKYIDDIIFDVKQPVIRATTYDNQANLPQGFIEGLKDIYDKLQFDRQVLGKKVSLVNNRFVYTLDDEEICNEFFVNGLEWNKNLPIYLSFDFNKDPLTCIAAQIWGNNVHILREICVHSQNLQTLCAKIVSLYGFGYYYITGDATGLTNGDNIQQDKFRHHYKLIEDCLKVPEANFLVPKANPRHQAVRLQINSMIQNQPTFLCNKDLCPEFYDDCMYVQADEKGSISENKDKRRTHFLQCVLYLLWHFYPEGRVLQNV